jgi:hypothetical protein
MRPGRPDPGEEAILVLRRRPAFDSDEDYDGGGDTTNDACFHGEEAANAVTVGGTPLVLNTPAVHGGARVSLSGPRGTAIAPRARRIE